MCAGGASASLSVGGFGGLGWGVVGSLALVDEVLQYFALGGVKFVAETDRVGLASWTDPQQAEFGAVQRESVVFRPVMPSTHHTEVVFVGDAVVFPRVDVVDVAMFRRPSAAGEPAVPVPGLDKTFLLRCRPIMQASFVDDF